MPREIEPDKLSDSEQDELNRRMDKFRLEGGDIQALMLEFMNEHGRIPTPADDGFSGWFARELAPNTELLMETRVASGMWRGLLNMLRDRQAHDDEKGGA